MPDVILDGRGSGNVAGVTADNRLMVDSVGGGASSGSESFIFGKSGTGWVAVRVLDDGAMRVFDPSGGAVSIGSESFIFGKSGTEWFPLRVISGAEGILVTNVNNFSDLGSDRVVTNFSDLGSDRVITNFSDLGSTRVIDSPTTIGSYTKQDVDMTHISGTPVPFFSPADSTYQGHNKLGVAGYMYALRELGGGSDPVFDRVRVDSGTNIGIGNLRVAIVPPAHSGGDIPVVGSVLITNSPTLSGSVEVFQTTNADMQVQATQETTPWIVNGSVHQFNSERQITAGSVNINNFDDLGSSVVVKAGSVEIYDGGNIITVDGTVTANQGTDPWIVLGSVRAVQDDTERQITAGSVNINNFDDLGSSVVIKSGSVEIYDGGNSITVDNAALSELGDAINLSRVDTNIAATDVDLMLGTDFSNVLGTTSIVTTATLGDNLANTTDVLNVRNLNYVFDGTNWDRAREPAGDNVSTPQWFAMTPMMFDGTSYDRMRGDSSNGVLVNLGGNNDIVGSVAITTSPLPVSGNNMGENVKKTDWTDLGSINGIYNNSGSEFTSPDINVSNARYVSVIYNVMKSGTPLDWQLFLESKGPNGSYYQYNRDFWGANIYDDATVGNPPGIFVQDDAEIFGGSIIRFRALARTVTSSNFFIISGASVYVRN